jgi:hypothetical protein
LWGGGLGCGRWVSGEAGWLKKDWCTRRGGNTASALCEDGTLGREFRFIKYDVTGKINFLRVGFKTTTAALISAIPEEDARFASKG